MALNFVITNVGKAAIAQAGTLGPVVLSTIQLGNAGYTPSPTQTALQAPIKSITPSGFSNPTPETIHFTVSDETTDTYTCQEIGIITSTGILFAVYSQPSPILVKVSTTAAFFAIDLVITGIPPGSYTLGGTGFSYPPASETVKGVSFLATQAEVNLGTDTLKVVTPATLRNRTYSVEYSNLSNDADYTKNTRKRVNSASINFDPAFLEAGNLTCTAGVIPVNGTIVAAAGSTLAVTALSDLGTWTMTNATTFEGDRFVGMIFKITSISGVANATLGGVNVSTLGVQITRAISATQLEFKMLSGAAITTQTGVNTFILNSNGIRSIYGCALTRLAAFDYRLTFTTPFTDTSYSWTGSVGTASTGSLWIGSPALPYNQWKTPSSLRFRAVSATATVSTNIMNDISIVVTATR
jgi:hypothetical protein